MGTWGVSILCLLQITLLWQDAGFGCLWFLTLKLRVLVISSQNQIPSTMVGAGEYRTEFFQREPEAMPLRVSSSSRDISLQSHCSFRVGCQHPHPRCWRGSTGLWESKHTPAAKLGSSEAYRAVTGAGHPEDASLDIPFLHSMKMVHVLSRKGKSFSLKEDSAGGGVPAPTPHKQNREVPAQLNCAHRTLQGIQPLTWFQLTNQRLKKELNRNDLSWSAVIPHRSVTLFTLMHKDGIKQKSQLKPILSTWLLEAVMTKKKKKEGTWSQHSPLKQIHLRWQEVCKWD